MSTQQAPTPSGRAGRYQRTTSGLVVSIVVTVLGLGLLLWFMGLFRPDFESRPEAVDYLDTVAAAQDGGLEPIYPATLPDGWTATSVEIDPAGEPAFRVGLLSEDQHFVGVLQQAASPLTLVRQWVDEDAETAEGYTVPDGVVDPVARDWDGYVDGDGELAYVAEVGDLTVLVHGTVSEADLQAVVRSLTDTPVAR